MKKLIRLSLLSVFVLSLPARAHQAASAYHNPNGKLYRYQCGEELTLTINYTINKANIAYKGSVLTRCENRDVIVQGEVFDYSEGQSSISCRGGDVELHNDYNELVLRPSSQIQKIYKSLKDYEYFCEKI